MRLLFSFALFLLSFLSRGQAPVKKTTFDIDSFMVTMDAKNKEAIGKPFPKFVAGEGKLKTNNDSLKGKVVLINFWFEGCHPCLAEFGPLNELAQLLSPNKNFEFISFTWDNPEAIKRVKQKYKLRFKVFAVDDDECRRLNQHNGYPTTIILDRQGIIKYLTVGGDTDIGKAKEFVMTTLLARIQNEL